MQKEKKRKEYVQGKCNKEKERKKRGEERDRRGKPRAERKTPLRRELLQSRAEERERERERVIEEGLIRA